MRRGTPILALVVALAAGATALAADRLISQQSPAAARLSALPGARAARLAERTGIAAPYWSVDPRTAKPVRLGQPLTTGAPIFPGDPPFTWRVWTTVPKSGYLLEQITSLGTHTGTHIRRRATSTSARRASSASRSGSSLHGHWSSSTCALQFSAGTGTGILVGTPDLRRFERRHGRIPPGSYVVLYTGLSRSTTWGTRAARGR